MLGTGPGRDFLTIRALFSSLFEAERPKLPDPPHSPRVNTPMTREMKTLGSLEVILIGYVSVKICDNLVS